jgi:Arc/MetJ-type ribon-helix-helix transcriptional regulator
MKRNGACRTALALRNGGSSIVMGAAKGESKMTSQLPADLDQYVDEKIATGAFASRDAFVQEAVRIYRELELRHDLLKADIQVALRESDDEMSAPLDMEAIQRELVEEIDERGRPK